MFLKNVKSWSLASRLMLLYSTSTISILIVISLFLYPTFSKILNATGSIPQYLSVECFENTIIALLIASLSTIVIGYYIARKGLGKIQDFSRKTECITAESLHERINPQDWPCELELLSHKFNGMLDRLQVSFTQLSQFSSDIAHELRNPLNNLTGITELALTKDRTTEEYKRILESNQDEYQHLTRLIENLLFLAYADHGQAILNKSSLQANSEIEKICDYYYALAAEKQIQLHLQGTATISADPTLFKRVMSNLISNAIRYTDEHGKIEIFIIKKTASMTEISIRDTGIGISEEHLPFLFNRFYRVDPSRSAQSGGLGLGLAIVKSIIALHQGDIQITSIAHKGTTVTLRLPS
jgi:two-component system heavy metal sensor histidine kinase CusS